MPRAIKLNDKDNVAVAVNDLNKGETVIITFKGQKKLKEVKTKGEIPFGHKLSLSQVTTEEEVIKYGEVIGKATENINEGDYVHVHNVESRRGRGDQVKN